MIGQISISPLNVHETVFAGFQQLADLSFFRNEMLTTW